MPGYTGHCLCGSCTIHIDHPHASSSSYDLQHVSCHCSDCQHTSGTSRTTSVLPKIEDVVMVGDIHQYHSKSAAGNTVTRLFCGTCGSSIGHRSQAIQGHIAIHTGNFPDFHSVTLCADPALNDPSKSKSLLFDLTPKSLPRNSPALCPRSAKSTATARSSTSTSTNPPHPTQSPKVQVEAQTRASIWDLSPLHSTSLDSPPPIPPRQVEERPTGVPKYSWELSPSYTKLDLPRIPSPQLDALKVVPEPRPTGVPLYSWELWEMSTAYEESFRLARFNHAQPSPGGQSTSREEARGEERQVDREEWVEGGSPLGKRQERVEGEVMEEVAGEDVASPMKKGKMDTPVESEVITRVELVEEKTAKSPCSRRGNARRSQRWKV